MVINYFVKKQTNQIFFSYWLHFFFWVVWHYGSHNAEVLNGLFLAFWGSWYFFLLLCCFWVFWAWALWKMTTKRQFISEVQKTTLWSRVHLPLPLTKRFQLILFITDIMLSQLRAQSLFKNKFNNKPLDYWLWVEIIWQ